MNYTGFYINLDRSTERRVGMEAQFAQYGLEGMYRRFPATVGNVLGIKYTNIRENEMGCFTSHYLLLKENLGRTNPIHVVEDDVLFSRHTAAAIQSLIAEDRLAHYDIIYTDVLIPTNNVVYKKYKELYDKSVQRDGAGNISQIGLSVVDLKNIGFATTSSMVIGPRGIAKLHDFYAEEFARGPALPVDLFIRRLTEEGKIRVGCIFPFVTSVRLGSAFDTTVGHEDLRLVVLAEIIARHSFFVDCNMKECRDYALKHLRLNPDDIHGQILARVIGFSFGPLFKFPG